MDRFTSKKKKLGTDSAINYHSMSPPCSHEHAIQANINKHACLMEYAILRDCVNKVCDKG